ncbi:MAG: hypothetical protein JWN72_1144 [Thermoleophilia bacterium]|nr:hypothetical protein [Thermoleophilia bacterium]
MTITPSAPQYTPAPATRVHYPTQFPAVERARAVRDGEAGRPPSVTTLGRHGEVQQQLVGAQADRIETAISGLLTSDITGSQVAPITNRSVSSALRMLEGNEGIRWGGSHTVPQDEYRLGIRAEGEQDVPVTYAMLHFSDTVVEPSTGATYDGGQPNYGPIAMVLKPDVMKRATYSDEDSASAARLQPVEGIPDAVAGAMLRRANGEDAPNAHYVRRIVADPAIGSAVYDADTGRGEVYQALRRATRGTDGTYAAPPLPEMQIYGRVRPTDVQEIRVTSGATQEELWAVESAAKVYGIPVVNLLDSPVYAKPTPSA